MMSDQSDSVGAGAPGGADPAAPAYPAAAPPAPPTPAPPSGGISGRLRELASARDEGLISAEEFDAAKARVLASSGLAGPVTTSAAASAAVAAAGTALLVAAVAVLGSYSFSYYDYDGFFTFRDEFWSAGWVSAAIAIAVFALGGITTLRARRLTPWVLVALPVALADLWQVPIANYSGIQSASGWSVVIYTLAVVALVAAVAIEWGRSGWTRIVIEPVSLSLAGVAAFAGVVAFNVDSFSYDGLTASFLLGSRWSTDSGWEIFVVAITLAAIVAAPVGAALLADARAGAGLAVGAALALIAFYYPTVWESLTGDLSMTAGIVWLLVAVAAVAALALLRWFAPESSVASPPAPPASGVA